MRSLALNNTIIFIQALLIAIYSNSLAAQTIKYELVEDSRINREVGNSVSLMGKFSILMDLENEKIVSGEINDIAFFDSNFELSITGDGRFFGTPTSTSGYLCIELNLRLNDLEDLSFTNNELGCPGFPGSFPKFRVLLFSMAAFPNYLLDLLVKPEDTEIKKFFKRGDINADGNRDITDAIFLLLTIFVEGEVPTCLDAADYTDDGILDISDSISLLSYLFLGSNLTPTPFYLCGLDLTPDTLDDCNGQPACMGS